MGMWSILAAKRFGIVLDELRARIMGDHGYYMDHYLNLYGFGETGAKSPKIMPEKF